MSSDEKLERDRKIAALAGSGVLPLSSIARETGASLSQVKYTLERKVPENRDGLGDVYATFRADALPIIQSIVMKALRKMDMRIDGAKVELKDLINVFNILQSAAGLYQDGGGETVQKITKTVDLRKPEMVKALRESLAVEREEKQRSEKALAAGENS